MDKLRVALLFGGKSTEHEVSLQSAKNVFEAMDKTRYEVILVGIDKQGQWFRCEAADYLQHADDPKRIAMRHHGQRVMLAPGESRYYLASPSDPSYRQELDVVFPVLHGAYGEDGTIQGLLKLANLPFVGPGVLGSAIGIDKDVTKRLLRDAGIPVAKFMSFTRGERERIDFERAVHYLGLPLFIKPANLGSSVGISKVKTAAEFTAAIDQAFHYDHKVLIEEFVPGRELECAVLGNEQPEASLVGEVIAHQEFYSYEAKYIDEQGAAVEAPADLSPEVVEQIQQMAIRAYKVLGCEGMARVDFFFIQGSRAVINEINTIPGFTKISMYPKLWAASGLSYSSLIDRLITLALQRFAREQAVEANYLG